MKVYSHKWLFRISLLLIVLLEIFSFFGNVYPLFNTAAFFVIVMVALFLTLIKLEYGLYLAAAELLIGSQGYLFAALPDGLNISLRMGLFLVVMSVGLLQIFNQRRIAFWQSRLKWWYAALAGEVGVGLALGLLNGHEWNDVFFDFNSWLYLLLILPVYQIFSGKSLAEKNFLARQLGVVALAALSASVLKSLFLLFLFSHYASDLLFPVYKWVRDTRVGEITLINENFYRVFFQSQIYSLLFAFPFLVYLFSFVLPVRQEKIRKDHWLVVLFSTLTFASVIISFSRSFWVGGIVGIWVLGIYLVFVQRHYLEGLIKFFLVPFSVAILALGLVILILKFPFPASRVSPLTSLDDRLAVTGAAVSSRLALFRPLTEAIIQAPPPGLGILLGEGFGATVAYQSFDPRVVRSSPASLYRTYAFEWGWLDIWLKIGFVGVLIYLGILINLIYLAFKNSLKNWRGNFREKGIISAGTGVAIIVLAVVNTFTPYLNHPLGIGFIVFTGAVLEHWLIEPAKSPSLETRSS